MAKINELSPNSKIWIYQSNRELSSDENNKANTLLQKFVSQWSAHQVPLSAAGELRNKRFIILAVDENKAGASGCSIDSSVRFMKTLEEQFGIKLFDRMSFAYKKGEKIEVLHKDGFSKEIEKGNIVSSTIVFNNLIKTSAELDTNWQVPFSESWHAHFFAKS